MKLDVLGAAFDKEIASVERQLNESFEGTFSVSREDWDWQLQGLAARVIYTAGGTDVSKVEDAAVRDAWAASFEIDKLTGNAYWKNRLVMCVALGSLMIEKSREFSANGDFIKAVETLSASALMAGDAAACATESKLLLTKKADDPNLKSDILDGISKIDSGFLDSGINGAETVEIVSEYLRERARKGGYARHRHMQEHKELVHEWWLRWQKEPDLYRNQDEFAAAMLDKYGKEVGGSLTSTATIKNKWIPEFRKAKKIDE